MPLTKRTLTTFVSAALLLPLANHLSAQDNEDDIYNLSPFEVDVSQDVGYAAQNTLAGSRMNTALKDTPAPISVYTAEFISDIGVDSLEEVLDYSVNMTPELSDVDGAFGANQLTAFDARYRVRGLDAGQARNYFETRIDQDVFNVERIDESRGPNSILFGIGLPGGVLNTSTKRPKYINFTTLDISVGNGNRFRTAVDVNQVLVEDKLSIRFNALYNDNEDPSRPHVYRRDKRYHLALQWRPTESTTFNVEYEIGDVVDSPTTPFGPSDRASLWIESGRPAAGDPGIDATQGVSGSYNTQRVTYIDNSGGIINLQGQALTNNPVYTRDNHFTYDNNRIDDPGKGAFVEVPLYAATSGPWHMRGTRDIDMMTANIEQKLWQGAFLEVVYATHEYHRDSYRLGGPPDLLGDANPTLPDGSPNAYFGELYFESQIELDERYWKDEWVRAMISQEFDLGKYFGRHRLAALYETQDGSFTRDSFSNAWTLPGGIGPYNATPDNGRNRVYYRHYLTDLENEDDWRVGNDPARTGIGFTYQDPNLGTLTSDMVQNRKFDDSREIDSLMLAGQSFLWEDRIIATFGIRQDDFYNFSPAHFRNSVNNQRDQINYNNASIIELNDHRTETYGLVFHVTDIVSLSANKATNAGLSGFADRDIYGKPGEAGQPVPVPAGESEDISIMFDLLDGRLFLKGTYYETSASKEASFISFNDIGLSAPGGAINTIYQNLQTGDPANGIAPFITQAVLDEQEPTAEVGTTSSLSEGYELSMTANITENWRLTANWSYIDSVLQDTFSEFGPWWAGSTGKPFFQTFPGDFVLPTDGPFEPGVTLADAISQIDAEYASLQARVGGTSPGQRHHKGNFFTKYTFTEGALRDFSIGGGARYRSGATWIQANPLLGQQEFGGMTIYDLVAGYKCEIFGLPVDFQLNVRNLLDKDDLNIVRLDDDINPSGGYNVFKYTLTPGRDIRLRARIRF